MIFKENNCIMSEITRLEKVANQKREELLPKNKYLEDSKEYGITDANISELAKDIYDSQIGKDWSSVGHAGSITDPELEANGYGFNTIDTSSINALRWP